jgi:hypothetical protein
MESLEKFHHAPLPVKVISQLDNIPPTNSQNGSTATSVTKLTVFEPFAKHVVKNLLNKK